MKNITNTAKTSLFLLLGIFFLAIPAVSHAQYYGHNNNNNVYVGWSTASQLPPYHEAPVYPHYPSYPTYPSYPVYPTYPVLAPLTASCYANSTSINTNQSVTWQATASGGNGVYTYTWGGSENLVGYNSVVYKTYAYSGAKTASVTIQSGSQSITISCNNTVEAYTTSYGNYNYNNYYNTANTYSGYGTYYNTPLNVSCTASTAFAPVGTNVIWTANVSGGDGYYTYSWSGSDGLYGSTQTMDVAYNSAGVKSAMVTVTADGQTISQECSNTITVGQPNSYGYNYGYNTVVPSAPIAPSNTTNSLAVACYPEASDVTVGTPVTWSVEVTGGSGQYTYAWSGTDGLAGSQQFVATAYNTPGKKSAVVIVSSSDGLIASKACGTTVTVTSGKHYGATSVAPATVIATPAPTVTPAPTLAPANATLGAVSFFSLGNIPWALVAVLVILVLFGTVLYLLFNKHKI